MRHPFWVSNSTEAENCTKKQTNEQINLLLENSKFFFFKFFNLPDLKIGFTLFYAWCK